MQKQIGLLSSRLRSEWGLNIILYSSRREIKVVVWSHSKALPKIELYIHSILIVQSYETHTHTHSLSLRLKVFESHHPQQMPLHTLIYNKNITIPTISSKLVIHLQPSLVWWYITKSHSVLWKKWIAVFKVKVIVKDQNVSERLSGWYPLNHPTLCYQTW